MAYITGLRGAYDSGVAQGRIGRGDGRSSYVLEGINYSANKGRSAASPFAYVPRGNAAALENWHYSNNPTGIVDHGAPTTDGNAEWFNTFVGGTGTWTLLGSAAGMEGQILDTSGATNGYGNVHIATPAFKSTTNRIAMMFGEFIFPAQTGHLGSIYFGFANKSVDPKNTAPTDGAWFEGVGSGTTNQFTTKTRSASGTATTTALASGGLLAAATATSIQLAVVLIGQVRAEFWHRDPSVAANQWVKLAVTTTLPAATVLLRPHYAYYADSGSAAQATNMRTPAYWFERPTLF